MAEIQLKCVTCHRAYDKQEVDYTCPACGPIRGTLEVVYDLETVRRRFRREDLKASRENSHWRYLPVLPIDQPERILPLSVGWTPLYRNPTLEREWQLKRVWIKDDSRNPTASYKDRASSVGVVKALERGARVVTAASTGNAASSWAAFTALAGLETVIFVPRHAPRAKIAQLLLFGAKVLQVEGTYDEAFDLCMQAAEKWGWYNRSTAINPYLGEGKKTAALEICEQLDWQVPDYVFVPVGDGCIIQGMWKGFRDFYHLGFIDRLPRLIGVQAAGSAPLVTAWEKGQDTVEPVEPRTFADSIAVGVPRDQVKALKAVRESGGRFIAVEDDAIRQAMALLARVGGIMAEPAAAAAFAGLRKMVLENLLPSHSTVLVQITGSGLKDIDGVFQAVRQSPIRIENSLAAVERALKV
ncbi:MAG: threonine synthase [Calditrichaeota bacterium]|nr:threonine synthase [Calditrichota bacterium]